MLTRSHNLREKTFTKGHIQTAFTLNSLGDLALKEGRDEEAEDLMRQSLKIFQVHNHPEAYMAFESLARFCLFKANKKGSPKEQQEKLRQEAHDYLNKALNLVNSVFPPDSAHISRIKKKLLG